MSQAGVDAGIGDVGDREGIQAEQLVGLAEQRVDGAAAVELRGGLDADIGAAAALDAVLAGELVDAEQIAGVEDQALRVFVGQLAGLGLVRTDDDLRDRLDRRGAPGLHVDERIAIFEADGRHDAQRLGVAGRQEVGDARLVRDLGVDRVGAQRSRTASRSRRPNR